MAVFAADFLVVDVDGVSNYDWEYRFTTRQYDRTTGLQHFRSRSYHPVLGRFVGRDSLGYVDGPGLDAAYFVPNGLDPWGQAEWHNDSGWDWLNPWTYWGLRKVPNWIGGYQPEPPNVPARPDVDSDGLPPGELRSGSLGTYYGSDYREAGRGAARLVDELCNQSTAAAGESVAGSMAAMAGGSGKGGYRRARRTPGRIPAISPPIHRDALRRAMGNPPKGLQNPNAHHDLPWAFNDWFAGAGRGLNVNEPRFGRWVEGTPPGQHQHWTHLYQGEWEQFIKDNRRATADEVIDFMYQLRCDRRFQ
jgi:RHS repeat-associated protein